MIANCAVRDQFDRPVDGAAAESEDAGDFLTIQNSVPMPVTKGE